MNQAFVVSEEILAARISNAALPALSLPLEILGPIFFDVCIHPRAVDKSAVHFDREPRYSDILRGARNALTAVCHHWRQMAIQTSSLWRNISVEFKVEEFSPDGDAIGPLRPAASLLELELTRASTPLRLRVEMEGIPQQWKKIAQLISPSLKLCESLHLVFDRPSMFEESGLNSPIPFHDLQTLILTSTAFFPGVYEINLSQAPSLKNLSLSSGYYPTNLPKDQRLQRVQIEPPLMHEHSTFISHSAKHLRQLKWTLTPQHIDSTLDEVAIELPALEELSYHVGYPAEKYRSVLHSIIAPNLRLLQLRDDSWRTAFPQDDQFPSLEHLSISSLHTDTEFFAGLRALPSLRTLALSRDLACPPGLIDALLLKNKEAEFVLLPQLCQFIVCIDDTAQAEHLVVARNEGISDVFQLRLFPRHGFEKLHEDFPWCVEEARTEIDPFSYELWTMIEPPFLSNSSF